MALSLSSLLPFLLLSLLSLQSHARQPTFFSKAVYPNSKPITNSPTTLPPAAAVEDGDTSTFFSDSGNNHGLYGHSTDQFPTTTDEFNSETFQTEDSTNKYDDAKEKYNKYGMSDTRFMDNGKYYYDLNNERNFDYKRYGEYPREGGERYGRERYEKKNYMEGYERNQGNDDDQFQEGYFP